MSRGVLYHLPLPGTRGEVLRASEGLYLIIYALAVILMMLFMPKGLIGVWDLMVEWRARGRRVATPLAVPPGAPDGG